MPVFNNVLAGASGQGTGYDIDQSLRFNHADSAYLSRTAGTATSNKVGTLSFWMKRGRLLFDHPIFSNHADASNRTYIDFYSDTLEVFGKISGSTQIELVSSQENRDPASWYHYVVAINTAESAAADRIKCYQNGVRITDFSTATYPALNADVPLLSTTNMLVGAQFSTSINGYWDGYLAEVNFIDGQALTPASFGETNSATNQWVPVEYSGSYGNNGFLQKYSAIELAASFADSAKSLLDRSDRESEIAVTSNQDWTNSGGAATSVVLDDLVNGVESNNDAGGGWAYSAWAVSGSYVRFDFGSAKTYSNAEWAWINSSATEGSWKWQGSNNASDWTDIGSSFTLSPGSVGVDSTVRRQSFATELGSNTTAYRYYQILGISGNMNTSGRRLGMYFGGWSDGVGHTITANGNITHSRAQSKFSSSAVYSSTTSEFLSTSPHILLPQAFTWEGWVRFDNATPGETSFFNLWDGASIGGHDNRSYRIWFQDGSPSKIGFAVSSDGDNPNSSEVFWNWTPSQNTWYYISVGRDSSNDCRAFIDGSAIGATQALTRTAFTPNTAATENYLGGSNGVWYQDVQFSTTNRYTSTYSVPTASVAADSNTVFLVNSDFDGGLGADSSGNKNDFAITNLVATDQVLDSTTRNYSTLNPLINSSGTPAYSEGNLVITPDGSNYSVYQSTIPVSSGKWYAEYLVGDTNTFAGVSSADQSASAYGSYWDNTSADFIFLNNNNGNKIIDGAATSYGTGATVGQIVGVAIDLDGNAINFYVNNSAQGSISFSGGVASASSFVFSGVGYAADAERWNFGADSSFSGAKTAQGNGDDGEDFFYTPPTGYKALNSSNLDDPAIALPTAHFNTILYTGNGGTQALTGVGFAPDFFWNKNRTGTYQHMLYNTISGATKYLSSGEQDAEATDVNSLTSFDSDGVTLGSAGSSNATGVTSVGWSWKAASSNTVVSAGSIDGTNPTIACTRRTNTDAGFSIVTYTGNGTSPSTIAHGLSVAPKIIFTKNRSLAGESWVVSVGNVTGTNGDFLVLDDARAVVAGTSQYPSQPGSTTFAVTDAPNVNANTDDYISYCFHSIEGYSKVGSYTGNANADGPFIYTGFRPAFVMVKGTSQTVNWEILDSVRNPYNILDKRIAPNTSNAEDTGAVVDFVSNGFKIRTTSGGYNDPSSATYIYYAVAESPFKTSNAR